MIASHASFTWFSMPWPRPFLELRLAAFKDGRAVDSLMSSDGQFVELTRPPLPGEKDSASTASQEAPGRQSSQPELRLKQLLLDCMSLPWSVARPLQTAAEAAGAQALPHFTLGGLAVTARGTRQARGGGEAGAGHVSWCASIHGLQEGARAVRAGSTDLPQASCEGPSAGWECGGRGATASRLLPRSGRRSRRSAA